MKRYYAKDTRPDIWSVSLKTTIKFMTMVVKEYDNDHFHVNNHKIDKKGMIKVLILKFFTQQTRHWMLVNIAYNNTCVV